MQAECEPVNNEYKSTSKKITAKWNLKLKE